MNIKLPASPLLRQAIGAGIGVVCVVSIYMVVQYAGDKLGAFVAIPGVNISENSNVRMMGRNNPAVEEQARISARTRYVLEQARLRAVAETSSSAAASAVAARTSLQQQYGIVTDPDASEAAQLTNTARARQLQRIARNSANQPLPEGEYSEYAYDGSSIPTDRADLHSSAPLTDTGITMSVIAVLAIGAAAVSVGKVVRRKVRQEA